jgi:Ni/Co efflux regulator RcnB
MWRITVLVLAVLALSLPSQAKPYQSKQHYAAGEASIEPFERDRSETFSPAERNLIRAHLNGSERKAAKQRQELPYGLQKKIARGGSLPPGWRDKVVPGHSLDYQVYRQGESLPGDLLRRLPPPPVGSEIIRVDEKIILLNTTTRTILDAFDLAPVD